MTPSPRNGKNLSVYMTYRDLAVLRWLAMWLIPDITYNQTPTVRKVLYERLIAEATARGITQAQVDASLEQMAEELK
jgi:hypothetical protein